MEEKINDKMQMAIERLKKGKWIESLQKCEDPLTALDQVISVALKEIIDQETRKADPMFTKRLICYLQNVYGIDLRICKQLIINEDELLCGKTGGTEKCDQDIISLFCKRRDQKSQTGQSGSSIIGCEGLHNYGSCATI